MKVIHPTAGLAIGWINEAIFPSIGWQHQPSGGARLQTGGVVTADGTMSPTDN
ncbi:hypothetical protein [Aliifodinibius salipaludis]|uniref:hypothetical protein n=1 Tax=Fodinibius salipaludis TaxID=2032627 RepID=UPI0015955EA1|nr:hypothetical protein [Aliifodinibius salipaludis]